MPLKPGQQLELSIAKLVPGGEGLARSTEGQAVFVPQGLPGDRVRAQVISIKPGYGRALIEEVLSPSPQRVRPPCPVVEACGGCQWQHQDYAAQLEAKRELLLETLSGIGGWEPDALRSICSAVAGMRDPWHYRNKGQFPFQRVAGRLEAGFYAPRSHQLVPVDSCLIHHRTINAILTWTVAAARAAGMEAYDETSRQGDLRHLIVRHGFDTDQTLVGIVTRRPDVPGLQALATAMREAFSSIVGVVQNIHPQAGNRILGEQNRVLTGSASYTDTLDGLSFEVSLPSFFQVNPIQTEVLYSLVAELAAAGPDDGILDAYSGAGTISLWLARRSRKVLGIEVVEAATLDARRNAALNGITGVDFVTGKVEDKLPGLLKSLGERPLVILDPPRKGCEPSVLETVARAGVSRLVYVSCNPATLARDSALLRKSGFDLRALRPVDMFPHTHHLETVALFER